MFWLYKAKETILVIQVVQMKIHVYIQKKIFKRHHLLYKKKIDYKEVNKLQRKKKKKRIVLLKKKINFHRQLVYITKLKLKNKNIVNIQKKKFKEKTNMSYYYADIKIIKGL